MSLDEFLALPPVALRALFDAIGEIAEQTERTRLAARLGLEE